MPSILVMDKPMRNNNGFTMVEVLFCLSIIIVLSSFTITLSIQKKDVSSIELEFSKVQSLLEEAKAIALTRHQRVDIEMEENSISYQNDDKDRTVILTDSYYFTNSKEVYFNANGNINQGNTISLCNQNLCKSIIFNVGSGDFYLKE